jgi:hypothetical protein
MKWEYDVIPLQTEKGIGQLKSELNAKGKDDWELVSILNYPGHEKFYFDKAVSLFALLKRQI